MRYTQIVNERDCILRIVYEWNPDEEMVDEVISMDIEDGNIVPLLSDEAYEDIIDQVYNLHDDEAIDT